MDPSAAAKIFDSMTDNLSLVAEILENMSSQARGDILAAMDTDTAAQVTEMMQP
jgi:flagellar motility protein MotE (MotC chaperone)